MPRTSTPRWAGRRRPPQHRGADRGAPRSGRCPRPERRASAACPAIDAAAVGRIFRENSGRSVATLIRVFGDIDVAEDAVQEAFAVALRRWPVDGLPPNPGGWITTTARNLPSTGCAANRVDANCSATSRCSARRRPHGIREEAGPVQDDRLRLIFTCCHPALSPEAQVALTLRLLGGLSTEEVARAFLVAEPTMAQRLVRAKRKIKAARIPYRVPAATTAGSPTRGSVCHLPHLQRRADQPSERRLRRGDPAGPHTGALMPEEPEVAGLLALLLLTESRRAPRSRPTARLVLLGEQDRTRWDRAMIDEGHAIVRALPAPQPTWPVPVASRDQRRAHRRRHEETDWSQIVALYDQLLAVAPTPVVALNRAVAIGEVHGPAAALALVDELDLDKYYPFHATRADLLDG